MKSKLSKKLSALCLVITANFSSFFGHAQIVYTDIKDVTVQCTKNGCTGPVDFYSLDLNNDGISDFIIHARAYPGGTYGAGYCTTFNEVAIDRLNDNSLLNVNGVVADLAPGSDINSSMEWSTGDIMKRLLCCYAYPPPKRSQGCEYSSEVGIWNGQGYVALKLILNDQTYFGWARLSVSVSSKQASFKIYDYAYQSTTGVSIIAGDTGALSVTKKPNDNANEEIVDANELKIAPNPVSGSGIISFSLLKPGKVSLSVNDMAGKLVKKFADKEYNEGSHNIKLNTNDMPAGIYLLRMESEGIQQTRKFIVMK